MNRIVKQGLLMVAVPVCRGDVAIWEFSHIGGSIECDRSACFSWASNRSIALPPDDHVIVTTPSLKEGATWP